MAIKQADIIPDIQGIRVLKVQRTWKKEQTSVTGLPMMAKWVVLRPCLSLGCL